MARCMVDVLIVDDQSLFHSVAQAVGGLVGGWRVVGEADSGEDAVATAAAVRPGVVLPGTSARTT